MRRLDDGRQRAQQVQERVTSDDRAQGEFADHHRMNGHLVAFEESDQRRIRAMKVIDPHRRVDEDHGVNDAPFDVR
jgi:hypothetical protein